MNKIWLCFITRNEKKREKYGRFHLILNFNSHGITFKIIVGIIGTDIETLLTLLFSVGLFVIAAKVKCIHQLSLGDFF